MHNNVNVMNNSYLYIDMNIFRENVNTILDSLPESTNLIPVLKDDAYGLGIERIAEQAVKFDRVQCIAVSHVSEGLALRQSGIEKDILVMSSALPFQLPAAIDAHLTLAAGSAEFVRALGAAAKERGRLALVHIKIDTGLHRIGVEPGKELAGLIDALHASKHIIPTGVFSHFSNTADAGQTKLQFERFMQAVSQLESAGFKGLTRHISCSAASELYPEYALDAVRAGRRLYMDSPDGTDHGIKELASWRTYVTAVKQRHAGDSLGYANELRLDRDAVIATLGIGYGDGLPREMCRMHAPVLIGGRECRLLATCMDQCFADVTGAGCKPGDEATVFGYDGFGNFISSQAQAALINGSEGCGLTSALSPRVARVYSE